jgi:hypothetical protein
MPPGCACPPGIACTVIGATCPGGFCPCAWPRSSVVLRRRPSPAFFEETPTHARPQILPSKSNRGRPTPMSGDCPCFPVHQPRTRWRNPSACIHQNLSRRYFLFARQSCVCFVSPYSRPRRQMLCLVQTLIYPASPDYPPEQFLCFRRAPDKILLAIMSRSTSTIYWHAFCTAPAVFYAAWVILNR